MEEVKKYEGSVSITSAEYRELVTEAVHYKAEYENERSTRWRVERENGELKKELEKTAKKLAYYVSLYGEVHESYWNK